MRIIMENELLKEAISAYVDRASNFPRISEMSPAIRDLTLPFKTVKVSE